MVKRATDVHFYFSDNYGRSQAYQIDKSYRCWKQDSNRPGTFCTEVQCLNLPQAMKEGGVCISGLGTCTTFLAVYLKMASEAANGL